MCMNITDCSGREHAIRCDFDTKACVCRRYWCGDECKQQFPDMMAPYFHIVFIAIAVLQIAVVVAAIYNAIGACVRRRRTPTRTRLAVSARMVQGLTAMASVVRALWTFNPLGFKRHLWSPFSAVVLLRIPQLLWILAFVFLLVYFETVLQQEIQHMKRYFSITGVALGVICFATVVVTVVVEYSFDTNYIANVCNGVIVSTAMLLLIISFPAAYQAWNIVNKDIKAFQSQPTQGQAEGDIARFKRKMREMQIVFTIIFVCVVGVFAAVWVADLLDVQPYNKPTGQLVFMAFVHFCEIMFSASLQYVSRVSRVGLLWPCKPTAPGHADGRNYLDRMVIRWSTRTQVEEEDKEDDDTETGGDPGTTVYGSAGSHVAAHASLLSHEESYYNTMDE